MNESSQKSGPTANKLLSASETLSLLERLRQAVREIISRAEQLEREFAGRSGKLKMQFDEALAQGHERRGTEVETENADVFAKRARAKSLFAARVARVAKALDNARKQRLAEVETNEARQTSENERQHKEADARRDADMQKSMVAHQTLMAGLENEREQLQRLEKQMRRTLGGYGPSARQLKSAPSTAGDIPADENQLLEQIHARREEAASALVRCRAFVLPLFFGLIPLWLCVLLILIAAFVFVPELRQFNFQAVPARVWAIVGAGLAGLVVLYFLTKSLIASAAKDAINAFNEARRLSYAGKEKVDEAFKRETSRIQAEHTVTTQALNQQWKQVYAKAKSLRMKWTLKLDERAQRLNAKNEERKQRRLSGIEKEHAERTVRLPEESAGRMKLLETKYAADIAVANAARENGQKSAETDWNTGVLPLAETLRGAAAAAEKFFPSWESKSWEQFKLPETFPHSTKFATLAVDLEKFCEVSLRNKKFTLPHSTELSLPMLLSVPRQASVLFETKQSGHGQAVGALNNLILRLLTSAPPARVEFTIFDPVGLGQNFAGIMHLADFEERLINSRIWTQQSHFEQRLAEINEHIEKVTQMYLRNEYESLAEYNAQAGRLAEKYHFLVIADFPANFSELAVKRLLSIATSGPRCGVHLLIHWDERRPMPVDFVPAELRKSAICIVPKGDSFILSNAAWDGIKLTLDTPPDAELATRLLQEIGKQSRDSYRVEMPFGEAVPPETEMWSLDTTDELRVPIGRTGATKLQYLSLGEGTRQHGLIAGKTGSGKSTLFHVIITNLSLWCNPEQVEFYLVDFKKGVEFKCYATHKLPLARVVAIESDREFGLSVLQRVDEELKRRGDLFRNVGAQDIAGFKRAGGKESTPRTLLIIDEFQEFFTEDDRISQNAALLLDRIVRQGRAFGIHVLLGSQTLGGAYTLARATIGQMAVRIALQCNEADAYLIMSEDNPAPRLLTRPGEAIYNDEGGAVQGNSPFQVVWLPDVERDEWLEKVTELAAKKHVTAPEPVVFEGNAPADVRDNTALRSLLDADSIEPASRARVWLGAPNSIKGPTEAVFRRQSGNHLLIVGQRDESARGMLAVALISLAAQHPKNSARFLIFDSSPPDSAEARSLDHVARALPQETTLVQPNDVAQAMISLGAEMERRNDSSVAASAPATYLFIHGLQNNKKLRYDEELSFSVDAAASAENPGLLLNKLITEGASMGFHVIATCDTYNNVMRSLSRKALSEFEMRVVFQMSANDSASLIETPAANSLGLYRAILFNGQQGLLETFRPYAPPDEVWLDEVATKLAKLHRTI